MKVTLAVAAVFAAAALSPPCACAYLDPGTGSYVVQVVIAALVGGGFALKIFWKRISDALRRLFSRGDTDDTGRK
ncbi:MAG: hypothetical protein WCP22_11625 [Chlamydiota bacterium]